MGDLWGDDTRTDDAIRIEHEFSLQNYVTLYFGDCLDFLKTIPDSSVQLVVTSPPYNIGKPYEKKTPIDSYRRNQSKVIEECVRVLKPEGSLCWQVGNLVDKGVVVPLDILLYDCFVRFGLRLRNRIVWHFGHGLHSSRRFSGRYETVLWFTKGDGYYFNLDAVRIPQSYPGKRHYKGPAKGEFSGNPLGKNPSDVWSIPNVKANHIEKTVHPCQFPVALVSRLVLSMSRVGDLVLDPFLGVGTTAATAVLQGRHAAGSEVVCQYYDIAVERVERAIRGSLKYRPDVDVQAPSPTDRVAANPWTGLSGLPLEPTGREPR